MKKMLAFLAAPIAAAGIGDEAQAGLFDEARLGVAVHNVDLNGGDPTVEDGADISVEALFTSPKPLRVIFSPRPYVLGSFNTAGDTDFWSAGLNWRQDFLRDQLFVDASFGLARHNGVIDLPPEGDPDRERIEADNILFGSRYLFRGALGLGVKLSSAWRAQVFYEHLSNGEILNGSSDRNQGLDNFGVKIGYSFGAQ